MDIKFVYDALLFLSIAVTLLLALYALRHTGVRGARCFGVLMGFALLWSLSYTIEISSEQLASRIFWLNVQQIGILLSPPVWLWLAIEFDETGIRLQQSHLPFLALPSVFALLLIWTNDFHYLARRDVSLVVVEGFALTQVTRNPLFLVFIVYSYLLLGAAGFLLARSVRRANKLHRSQAVLFLLAFLLPFIANVALFLGVHPFRPYGSTVITFIPSGLLIAWGIFRYRLLEVWPIAREQVIENAKDVVLVCDMQGRLVDANPAAMALLATGHESLTPKVLGRPVEQALSAWPQWVRAVQDGGVTSFDLAVNTGSHTKHFFVTVSDVMGKNRAPIGRLSLGHDITARKNSEQELQASRQMLLSVLDSMDAHVYVIDLATNEVLFQNRRARDSVGEVVGEKCWESVHAQASSECSTCISSELLDANNEPVGVHHWEFHNTSLGRWFDCHARAIRWVDGRMVRLEIATEVTQRKQHEAKLWQLSFEDRLTGLHNRAYLEDQMRSMRRPDEFPVSVISVDLDALKFINDSLGHQKGDEMLIACANVLRQAVRPQDSLARFGGDEFVVLMPRTDQEQGKLMSKHLRDRVEEYNLQNPEIPLVISIGLSMAQSPSEIARAVQTADDLMYRDKIARRNEAHKRIADALLLNMAKKDYDSSENTHRLSALACFVGRRLGLTESQLHRLSLLAHVHDIGTISIPDHVLFKEGPLTNAERALVHTHPEKGHRIASHCTDLAEVADLILKHHERWDGTGYPLGLAGDEIPTECRVFSLVDAFCSMTGPRPFRGARTHDGALDEIERCTGTQFDPRLVPGFVSSMREYAHE